MKLSTRQKQELFVRLLAAIIGFLAIVWIFS